MNHAESSAAAAPGYLTTFALQSEPFADPVDSRFFYAGTTLMQRLDLLTHLTQFGDSVVLVTGPTGSGKTTLLGRYLEQASSQWRLCLLDAEQDFGQFLTRLAEAVGSGPLPSEQELLSHWADHSDSSHLLVVAVDNADRLVEADLHRLCKMLRHAAANRVRLILFGLAETQRNLKEAFEKGALSCTTQRLEMPRLSEEETSSYLMYRLAVAGYSGESPFTATEVSAICKAADGRPADINRLAHETLLERHSRTHSRGLSRSLAGAKPNRLGWAIAALGVLSATLYLLWQQFMPASSDAHLGRSQQGPIAELPLAIPDRAPTPATEQLGVPATTVVQATAPAPKALPELTEPDARHEPQQSSPAEPLGDEPTTPSPPVTMTNGGESVAPVPEPADAAVAGSEDSLADEPADERPEQVSAAAPAGVKSQPQAAPVMAATEPEAETERFPRRESWLLDQPEESFSLQLLGSRNEKSIAEYIRSHKLDERQSAYYRGFYRGDHWYVLMYGIYPTKKAALEGRDRLPAKVRKLKPWPRSLKSVHTAIREVQ